MPRTWAWGTVALLALAGCAGTDAPEAPPDPPPEAPALRCDHGGEFPDPQVVVAVETSQGVFQVALDGARAPITVCNLLRYVDQGFYDATTFHRICQGFVIQAGGVEPDGSQRPTHEPIPNEARDSGLKNVARSVAMGRTAEPDTATSHWYVNLRDNPHLDPGGYDEWGFAVFGNVTQGWSVVEQIAQTPVVPSLEGCQGRPLPGLHVTIHSIRPVA